MYYLRTRPAAQAIQFTLDHSLVAQVKQQKEQQETQPIAKTAPITRPAPSTQALQSAQPSEVLTQPVAASPSVTATVAETVPTASTPTPTATSRGSSPSTPSYPLTPADSHDDNLAGLDAVQRRAAEKDPEFAAALLRKKARELEVERLLGFYCGCILPIGAATRHIPHFLSCILSV